MHGASQCPASGGPSRPDSGVDLKILYSLKNTAFDHLVQQGPPAAAPSNPTPCGQRLLGYAGTLVSVPLGARFMPGRPSASCGSQARWADNLGAHMRGGDSNGGGSQMPAQWPSEAARIFSHQPSWPTGGDCALEHRLGPREVTLGEVAGGRRPSLLAVIPVLTRAADEALVAPFAPRALGLGEGLLEGVLLGVHLVIQELGRQLCPVPNLDLCGARQPSPHRWGPRHTPPWVSHTVAWGLLPDAHLECRLQEHGAWGLVTCTCLPDPGTKARA